MAEKRNATLKDQHIKDIKIQQKTASVRRRGEMNILKEKGVPIMKKLKNLSEFDKKTSGTAKKDGGFSQHMKVSGAISAHGGRPIVQGGGK